jgi:hypothetical protein
VAGRCQNFSIGRKSNTADIACGLVPRECNFRFLNSRVGLSHRQIHRQDIHRRMKIPPIGRVCLPEGVSVAKVELLTDCNYKSDYSYCRVDSMTRDREMEEIDGSACKRHHPSQHRAHLLLSLRQSSANPAIWIDHHRSSFPDLFAPGLPQILLGWHQVLSKHRPYK